MLYCTHTHTLVSTVDCWLLTCWCMSLWDKKSTKVENHQGKTTTNPNSLYLPTLACLHAVLSICPYYQSIQAIILPKLLFYLTYPYSTICPGAAPYEPTSEPYPYPRVHISAAEVSRTIDDPLPDTPSVILIHPLTHLTNPQLSDLIVTQIGE